MGRIEYWDPVSQSRKPAKAGSIVNNDGLEYAPEDVKEIDDKIGILKGAGVAKEKVDKAEFDAHKAEKANPHNVTKTQIGLDKVDNTKQIPSSGGNFTGIAKAYSNTSYTVGQIRNIILSPNNANNSAMNNGDIWIKYE